MKIVIEDSKGFIRYMSVNKKGEVFTPQKKLYGTLDDFFNTLNFLRNTKCLYLPFEFLLKHNLIRKRK